MKSDQPNEELAAEMALERIEALQRENAQLKAQLEHNEEEIGNKTAHCEQLKAQLEEINQEAFCSQLPQDYWRIKSELQWRDELVELAERLNGVDTYTLSDLRRAASELRYMADCGKDYISVSELTPIIELLEVFIRETHDAEDIPIGLSQPLANLKALQEKANK